MSILKRCAHLAFKHGQRNEAIVCTAASASALTLSQDFESNAVAPSSSNLSSRPACAVAALPRHIFVSHGARHAGTQCRLYGMQAVDPWQDKISSNFRGGNEKYINVPIDEFSEHVSITNEIEKTLQEADNVDAIFEIVSQHKDEFEGPNIATALMALHHQTAEMSPEEHSRVVHGRPEFEMLLRMVEERMTFDVFTLMQTLQSLVGLHLRDEELLSNISARLTTLVQASDAKQLIKLIKRMSKSEYVPTRNLLEAIHRRVNAIKGTVHPETCSDIERAVTKLAVMMSEGRSKQKAMSVGQ